MNRGRVYLRQLSKWGEPAQGRYFLASLLRGIGFAFFLLPLGALLVRAMTDWDAGIQVLGLVLGWCVFCIGFAALATRLRRTDVVASARHLDGVAGGGERFLTATDFAVQGKTGSFLDPLIGDVTRELERHESTVRPPVPLKIPSLTRAAFSCILAFLILFLPGMNDGLFGPPKGGGAGEISIPGGDAADAHRGSGVRNTDLGDRIGVAASTDRSIYLLGEDIHFTVRVESLEPSPPGIGLACRIRVDGEHVFDVPLEMELPAEAGVVQETRTVLNGMLQERDLYKRGLLAIDTVVHTEKTTDPVNGVVEGNRVVIQISENVKKHRTRHPQEVARKRSENRRRNQDNPPRKPDREPGKKHSDRDRKKKKPARTPAEAPIGEINAKPHVVEPLFAGDQRSEREIRVYERGTEVDRTKRNAPARDIPSRSYNKGRETKILKMPLTGLERELVRRYLDSIRSAAGEGGR